MYLKKKTFFNANLLEKFPEMYLEKLIFFQSNKKNINLTIISEHPASLSFRGGIQMSTNNRSIFHNFRGL